MNRDSKIKGQWHTMLSGMIQNYRAENPEDTRSDEELLTSLMDHFVKHGLIEKTSDGKYLLPGINFNQ